MESLIKALLLTLEDFTHVQEITSDVQLGSIGLTLRSVSPLTESDETEIFCEHTYLLKTNHTVPLVGDDL